MSEALLDEIESLEAILMDDVKITRNPETGFPELIETIVFPTVGEDTDRQYICVTLQVIPSADYPEVSPVFKLQKPRGLDDGRLAEMVGACARKLTESIGYPVVFDLIDAIREHLTGSNLPSGQCVVCLYGFRDGDEFTKTECYHYLHSYCLARHLIASRRNYNEEQEKLPAWQRKLSKPFEPVCPVCREEIKDDYDHIRTAMPPNELEMAPEFHLTDELKDLQAKMTNLYLHQKSLGGIIDVGADEGNVISIEPEEQSADDRKGGGGGGGGDEIDGSANLSTETVPVLQTQAQSIRQPSRSNSHQGSQQQRSLNRNMPNQNNSTQSATNSQRYNTEVGSNSHHNRRHYNRGRRHHNYGHHRHNQPQQQQQQQPQDKTNDPTSSNSKSR